MQNYQGCFQTPCYYTQNCQPQMVVDVNAEVVNEREQLRAQLMDLEERYQIDIEELKVNLLQESERILQKQLNEQQSHYENILRQKDGQINQMGGKIQQLEQVNDKLMKDNQFLTSKFNRKKEKIANLKEELNQQQAMYERKLAEIDSYWRVKLQEQLKYQEEELTQKFSLEKQNLEEQIRRLKQLCAQFEDKYKEMLQELERLKTLLQEKSSEMEEWMTKYKSLEKKYEMEMSKKTRNVSPTETRNLEYQIELLQKEIVKKDEKLKKKKEKVQQPVYQAPTPNAIIIEKPVERIVEIEKIVPVERIIRERLPARQPIVVQKCCPETETNVYEEEYKSIKKEVKKYKSTITELQNQLNMLRQEYDEVIDDREELKRQLHLLTLKIKEMEDLFRMKNRELTDRIGSMNQNRGRDDDRIIVHLNDGKNRQSHVVKR